MFRKTIGQVRLKLSRSPFTVTGRLLAIAAAFCLFAVIDTTLTKILSSALWLLVIGFFSGVLFRPKLLVTPRDVGVVLNGQSFDFQLLITNCGRLGAYDLQCTLELPHEGLASSEPTQFLSCIAAGESVTINYKLEATKRGVFELDRMAVASLFPLSLFRFLAISKIKQLIHVAPSCQSQDDISGDIVEGLELSEFVGGSRRNSLLEYIGSREFRPGVPVRRWDFASWARLGIPSIREFSEGSDTVVVVVVDITSRARSFDPMLENTLSIATGVLVGIEATGQSILMILVGHEIDIGDGTNELEACLIRLAKVKGAKANIDWENAWECIVQEVPENASFVALLSDAGAIASLSHLNLGSRKVVACPVAEVFRANQRKSPVQELLNEEYAS